MIDAHVHLWQIGRQACRWPGPDLPALFRDFAAADLWQAAAGTGVTRAVLVQSQPAEADTRWLLAQARGDVRVAGVVGWVDLAATDAAARLAALAGAGPLVGIRPMVQDLADDWYDDPALDAGLAAMAGRGLVLEALVKPRHLPALARLVARHPTLAVVIDHAAKPAIGGDLSSWRRAMRVLCGYRRVACKLSGLVTEVAADGATEDTVPVAAELLAMFGPDRLIWGSDWPVVMLRAAYREWWDLAWATVPAAHRSAVFGGNAQRIYRLPVPAGAAADAA